MGYYARSTDSNMNFTGDAEEKAFAACLASPEVLELLTDHHGNYKPEDFKTLEDICESVGFDEWFWQRDKYREEWFMPLLESIAPFVDEGSFLEFSGEEADLWRFVFKDGKVYEISPEITWPEVG